MAVVAADAAAPGEGTLVMVTASTTAIGPLLRDWRQRRRLSQLDLALEAGVSTRHLSFVETGRSRPSPEMVLHLADQLEVPLRERNQLLLAAGYAPRYGARSLDDPELAQIRDALGHVLAGHEPYPAIAVDRCWNLVDVQQRAGPAAGRRRRRAAGAAGQLHAARAAPRRARAADRQPRRVARPPAAAARPRAAADRRPRARGAATTRSATTRGRSSDDAPDAGAIMVAAAARGPGGGGELAFFSTITTFGTAADITVSELSVEAFFPADAATADGAPLPRALDAHRASAGAAAGSSAGFGQPPSLGVDVDARRDDLVDPVQHVVGQRHVGRGQLRLEVLHRPRADDRRGHRRVADHERERHLDQRDPGLVGQLGRARRRPRACAGWRAARGRSGPAAARRAATAAASASLR